MHVITLPHSAEYVANIDPKRPTPHRPPLQPPQKAEAAPRPPATAESKREVETQRASLREAEAQRAAEERGAAEADAQRATLRKGEERGASEDISLREALQAEERAKVRRRKPRPPSRLTLAANPCG